MGKVEQNLVNGLFYVQYLVELDREIKDVRNFSSLNRKEVENWMKTNG